MNVEDNHISAAKAYAAKLIADPAALERLLAEHPELVPKPVNALSDVMFSLGLIPYATSMEVRAELAKHGYAVCKVATDEERLFEARELCVKVAEEIDRVYAANYRNGAYDREPEMIAMVAALRARDGVA